MPELAVPDSPNLRDGVRFVRELERRLERFDRAILEADWDLFSGRSSKGSEPWQLARGRLLSNGEILSWVRRARTVPWPALFARRLELLERVLVDARVEQHPEVVRRRAALQRAIVVFRPRWNGRRVERSEIYRVVETDPDPERRRRAAYALEPLYRPLEDRLRGLVRLRNELARREGFPSFAAMRLGFEGVSVARLKELARAAVAPTRRVARWLRDRAVDRLGTWHPWDLSFALGQAAPLTDRAFPRTGILPTVFRAIRGWAFPVDRYRFRLAFHDIPMGGLTLAPNPPRDVRILVHPQGGWQAYRVMFHEVGHAVHSAAIRAPRHLLRWHENYPSFGGLHEGIGGFFEEIPRDPRWLADRPGVSRSAAESFAEVRRNTDLFGAARVATWMHTELALYERPDRDPQPEVTRLERRLFGYDDFEPLSFVDSFFVDSPVYAPNYLLADLFHYQLAARIRELFGAPLWPNRRVGPWLTREWFRHGSRFDWLPRIEEVSGRPFGAEAFAEAFRS